MKSQSLFFITLGFLAVSSVGNADPIPTSNCVGNVGNSGFTCNFYESFNGAPSETSDIVSFPQAVSSGYIVLLESPSSNQTDPTQWSDVLQFIDTGTPLSPSGLATTGQLLSSGCNCFPTYATVQSSVAFLVETQVGAGNDFLDSTQFIAGAGTIAPDIFNIFSAAPDPVSTPEPGSVVLFGSGLVLVLARVRVRRARPW